MIYGSTGAVGRVHKCFIKGIGAIIVEFSQMVKNPRGCQKITRGMGSTSKQIQTLGVGNERYG